MEAMEAAEKPQFENAHQRQLYRHVERNGTISRSRLRDAVGLNVDHFYQGVLDLKQKGYLKEQAGTLRVAVEVGGRETHSSGGIEYSTRPARQDDLRELVKVMRQITRDQPYIVAQALAEQLLYEDTVIRQTDVQSRVFFVAIADDAIIGWTHLDTSPLAMLGQTAQQTVGVLEPYRGYGIGGRLVQRGLQWAVANDYRKVYNSVPATNEDAIAFLETYGWECEAVRTDHYTIDDESVNEVMMAVYPAEPTEIRPE